MRVENTVQALGVEAYPSDPAFPQLEVATDAGRMLEVLRAHLRPVPGKACQILDCAPFRFRCRQSETRCVLQYTLVLADPDTGRRWEQWVTGLIYAEEGEAERLWRKLWGADPLREVPEPWRTFEPVGFIPELDMLVEVFPFDRRLPQLGRVLSGPVGDLKSLLLAQLGPGRWQAAEPVLEPRRYRTELGAVLRCEMPARDAETGRTRTASCYVKVHRSQRGRETFEWLRSWSRNTRGQSRLYSVVRPLDYVEELRTLVLEEAPGTPLQHLLLHADDPLAAVRAAARAVAAFNQDELEIPRSHALVDQLDDVSRSSAMVQWACPSVRAEARAITSVVMAGLEEVRPAPLHGDLKADHVFLSDGRVIFVDLDAVALGDPVRDPAHFCSYVLGRVGLVSMAPERARAVAATFVEEYFRHVPASWRKQFHLHLAGSLIEVACGLFRHQGPQWREQVQAAVVEARRALAGGSG